MEDKVLFVNDLVHLALNGLTPTGSDIRATGNQGADAELQYLTAAFIITPK